MKLRDLLNETFDLSNFTKKILSISPDAKIGKFKDGEIKVLCRGIGTFIFHPELDYIRAIFNGSSGRDWSKSVGSLDNQILEFKRLYEKYS